MEIHKLLSPCDNEAEGPAMETNGPTSPSSSSSSPLPPPHHLPANLSPKAFKCSSSSSSFGPVGPMSDEMWIKIFAFLPPHVLCTVGLVCAEWRRLASDNMLWKEHYRAAWPWDTSVLATAGRALPRDPSGAADQQPEHAAEANKVQQSAPMATADGQPAQSKGSRKRKAEDDAQDKGKDKRGRVVVASRLFSGADAADSADESEMVVTLSPHIAATLDQEDTAAAAPKPEEGAGVQDLFAHFFGHSFLGKQKKLGLATSKQVVLPKPPVGIQGRWKRIYFAKKKYERNLLQNLPKEDDLVHSLPCSLEELYNGRVRKMKITRHVVCAMCGGAGGMTEGAAEECTDCNGIGTKTVTKILIPPLVQQVVSPCSKCNTRGYTLQACDRCPLCAGRAVVYRPEILEVRVERGMAIGQRLVFPGMSDAKPGTRPGDVIFVVSEKKEDTKPFQRIGSSNDLLYTQHLTLNEALTGAAFPIVHMDNRVLLVRPHEYGSDAGIIKTGDMVVIRGEGMPVFTPPYSSSSRPKVGDLHIIFNVVFPTHDDIAKSEEKKKIFARVVEDLALLQPREPIETVIAGRSVVPVFAAKAPTKPGTRSAVDERNGEEARARRKAEKRRRRGEEYGKNDSESVKCHQQ